MLKKFSVECAQTGTLQMKNSNNAIQSFSSLHDQLPTGTNEVIKKALAFGALNEL